MFESQYELRAGYLLRDELSVVAFRGHERLSASYEFTIDVASELDLPTLQFAILGHTAFMRWTVDGREPRHIFGVIQSVAAVSSNENGAQSSAPADPFAWTEPTTSDGVSARRRTFRLVLVPRIALLGYRTNSRIFQSKTVREIVETIFLEHGVASHWSETIRLEPRAYCVQYKETDYEFVARILEEEGVFYYFTHPEVDDHNIEDAARETVAKLASIAGMSDLDSLAGWSPCGAVGKETVALSFDAEYPAIGEESPPAGASTDAQLPVLVYTIAGSSGALSVEEVVSTFEWTRVLTPQCATVGETQLVDTVTSMATTPRTVDDTRAVHEGVMAMIRTLARSSGASAKVGGLQTLSMHHVLSASTLAISRKQAEVYDHDECWDDANALPSANRLLQSLRRDRINASVQSRVQRIAAGRRFAIDHPVVDINGPYVVTHVAHFGQSHFASAAPTDDAHNEYRNEFECVPASVAVRPDRRTKPPQQILETATVVGTGDLDSADDAHAGCVKLRFHWNRATDTSDGENTCWIPVMQPWAGGSFGFQFIPRVGMQVIVGFAAGSESQPIILGTRHHQVAQPPFVLPDHITQSGIRTRALSMEDPDGDATPRPDRYNELCFEDDYGVEYARLFSHGDVRLHAEQDGLIHARDALKLTSHVLEVATEDDQRFVVGGSEVHEVAHAQFQMIGGDLVVSVDGSHSSTVGEFVQSTSGSDVTVTGDSVSRVVGDREDVTLGDATQRTGGAHRILVEGEVEMSTLDTLRLKAPGGLIIECGQSKIELTPSEIVLSSPNIRAEAVKDLLFNANKNKTALEFSEGKALIRVKEKVEVYSDEIHLYGKDSTVDMSKDGITLAAKKALEADGGDSVTLNGKSASLTLDSNAALTGSKVKLKSGGSATTAAKDKSEDPEDKKDVHYLAMALMSPGGQPIAFEFVNVIDPDTDEIVVGPIETDEKGEIRVEVPDEGPYDIQIIADEPIEREQRHDHEVTWEVHARFVDHHGDAMAGLKVAVDGAATMDAVTDDSGHIGLVAPRGAYTLTVREEVFHAHASRMSHRSLDGSRGYVFVIDPEEPTGIAPTMRENRASAYAQQPEEEEQV